MMPSKNNEESEKIKKLFTEFEKEICLVEHLEKEEDVMMTQVMAAVKTGKPMKKITMQDILPRVGTDDDEAFSCPLPKRFERSTALVCLAPMSLLMRYWLHLHPKNGLVVSRVWTE
jgi:hypothetical protein